ncbi:MAG: hypothetical protein JZU55_21180 [Afipia sp.]|nr:hypothetical protein [Afipia sp.]MCR6736349.1 hypothetical protein [Afipia sp.]
MTGVALTRHAVGSVSVFRHDDKRATMPRRFGKRIRDQKPFCESALGKLRKSSPLRAAILQKAILPENIFIAKIRDSESVKRHFWPLRPSA